MYQVYSIRGCRGLMDGRDDDGRDGTILEKLTHPHFYAPRIRHMHQTLKLSISKIPIKGKHRGSGGSALSS